MHQLLDVRPWPRALLRYPLLILTALLLGALLAFAYSYAPLHSAKNWRIDYLEGRLASRNDQVGEIEAELETARASLEGTPSDEEVRALRTRLEEASKLADSREKEAGALERKLKSMTRSRDSWKKRHAAAMTDLEEQTSVAAAEPAATPHENSSETAPQPDPVPAAPALVPAETADIHPEEQP